MFGTVSRFTRAAATGTELGTRLALLARALAFGVPALAGCAAHHPTALAAAPADAATRPAAPTSSPRAQPSTTPPSATAPSSVPQPASALAAPVNASAAPVAPILNGCVSTGTIEATLLPPNILFLIDRSGSMNCNLPDVTSSQDCERTATRQDAMKPSKWEIVKAALQAAIEQLPDSASVGVTYFSNDDMCGVQSRPNVALSLLDAPQRKSLNASLDAVQPRGGTPIVGGLILAYKALNPDQTANLPYGKKIVVLLTDGQEGCAADATDRLLQTEMPNAIKARITTFVIGVPGSEIDRRFLSQMAFAGGAPSRPECDHTSDDPSAGDCHFDMTKQADLGQALNTALAAISGRALQCEFDVPQPNAGQTLDYGSVNVTYKADPAASEQLIAQDAMRACDGGANGWQYNADNSKIVLCGGACDSVRHAASIRIVLGCKSVEVE
jgi:hypothetical protein